MRGLGVGGMDSYVAQPLDCHLRGKKRLIIASCNVSFPHRLVVQVSGRRRWRFGGQRRRSLYSARAVCLVSPRAAARRQALPVELSEYSWMFPAPVQPAWSLSPIPGWPSCAHLRFPSRTPEVRHTTCSSPHSKTGQSSLCGLLRAWRPLQRVL